MLGLKLALIIMLLCSGPVAMAQAPDWKMAITMPTTKGYSIVGALAANDGDDLYLVGTFENEVSFGSITLRSAGFRDMFLARWNTVAQVFVWAQRTGGVGDEVAMAAAVSGNNIYVAGMFGTDAPGYETVFGGTSLTSAGRDDVFVTKYTDDGQNGRCVWAQRAGGVDSDVVSAVAVRGMEVYVTGSFDSPRFTAGTINLINAGTRPNPTLEPNGFVAKLTDEGSTGRFVWAQPISTTGQARATALAVSGTSVYVAGWFDYADVHLGSFTITDYRQAKLFIAKLNDAGISSSFVWAQQVGSDLNASIHALAVNGAAVYIAGNYRSATARFGAITLVNTSGLGSGGGNEAFVARLDDTGSTAAFAWATQIGSFGEESARALAVQGNTLYIAGYFTSAKVAFGSTVLTNTKPFFQDNSFVAKLTDAATDAKWVWAQQSEIGDGERMSGLVINNGRLYIAGGVRMPAQFGRYTLSGLSFLQGFLAGLDDPALSRTGVGATLIVYPNPAHNLTTVWLPSMGHAITATLTLRDVLGRAVRTQKVAPNTRTELDLTGLKPGLYAVQVTADTQTAARLLVVE